MILLDNLVTKHTCWLMWNFKCKPIVEKNLLGNNISHNVIIEHHWCQGWEWVMPVDPQSNLDVTHIWPTCWNFLKGSHGKNQIWDDSLDFFVLGRIQKWYLVQNSLEWNLWTLYLLQNCLRYRASKLISYQWWPSAFTRPKVHLLIRRQCLFL